MALSLPWLGSWGLLEVNMRGQDVIASMFFLILTYLLVVNWRGASALVTSSGSAVIGLTRTLQGRG